MSPIAGHQISGLQILQTEIPWIITLWGVLEQDVNEAPHNTVESLKQSIEGAMASLNKEQMIKAYGQFRQCLQVVDNNGGHFEWFFWNNYVLKIYITYFLFIIGQAKHVFHAKLSSIIDKNLNLYISQNMDQENIYQVFLINNM